MSSKHDPNEKDEMQAEYDFSNAIRGKYVKRFPSDVVMVTLEPDVAAAFPDAQSVQRSPARVLIKAADLPSLPLLDALRASPPLLFALLRPIAAQTPAQTPNQPMDIGIIVTPTQQRAEAVLTQLRAGWDFAVLAKENSLDSTADAGGYFGRLGPSQLQPQLRDALAGLHPGDYSSNVLQTPSGFAILTIFKTPPPQADPDGKDIQSMARSGVVRYGIDVGGMGEADALFNDASKPDGWNQDLAPGSAPFANKHLIRRHKAPAAGGSSHPPPIHSRDSAITIALGQILAYQAEMESAVEQFSQALDIAKTNVPDAVSYFHELLGVAYLHWAEMDNDAYRGSTDLDTFPPPPGAHFTKTGNAQKAADSLQQYLAEENPTTCRLAGCSIFAYGILGKYPAGVPAKFLDSALVVRIKENLGRFKDIAPALGVDAFLSRRLWPGCHR